MHQYNIYCIKFKNFENQFFPMSYLIVLILKRYGLLGTFPKNNCSKNLSGYLPQLELGEEFIKVLHHLFSDHYVICTIVITNEIYSINIVYTKIGIEIFLNFMFKIRLLQTTKSLGFDNIKHININYTLTSNVKVITLKFNVEVTTLKPNVKVTVTLFLYSTFHHVFIHIYIQNILLIFCICSR